MGFSYHSEHGGDRRVTHLVMAGRYLGVLVLGLCCTLPVVCGQGYVNIAPGKSYDQSSTYDSGFLSRYATNGNTFSCYPRFNSKSEINPYWEVDLGNTYPVYSIILWSSSSSLSGTNMFPVNITVDGQHCVTVSSNPTSFRNNSLTCSSVLYGRRLRVTGTGTGRQLNLCEIEILVPRGDSRCDEGRWGSQCQHYCTNNCGAAAAPNFCYESTLNCYDECVAGRWGDRCQNRCSQNCATGDCGLNTGNCSACLPGWYDDQCNTRCPSHSCLLNTCHHTTGHCLACHTGYDGDTCTGCVDGRHGATCNMACSPAGCHTCHQHSGQCTACRPLYNLDLTSQCKECADGFYRKTADAVHCTECSGRCHNNMTCNKTTGDCDRCPPGWEGPRCFTGVSEGEAEKLMGPVVGAITGVGLLLVVSLLVFLCWKQRSQKTVHKTDKTTTSASDPVSAHNPSALSAEPQADTQHEIRDPGNPYEQLSIYSNMVFERELPVAPESRADDVTATSGHADISLDNIYVNSTTTTSKNVNPRSKKAK